MKKHEDKLSEAVARLKQEGQSQNVPQEVVDETVRKIADCGLRIADSRTRALPIRNPKSEIRNLFRLAAAAAIILFAGYAAGHWSAPKPPNLEQLREALAPSVAAALEPALRRQIVQDVRRDYQVALAATYVRIKEELTEQYRSDLNRLALQTFAASNAVTNELLTQALQDINTAKTQDLRRITRALYEIEMNRVQDRTQLASGLQTLANRTEEIGQFLVDVRPASFDVPPAEPRHPYDERNKP